MILTIKKYGLRVGTGALALGAAMAPALAFAAGPQDLIDTAEAGFASTTGFSVADTVTWSADNLIKVFIGSGLALLYELRYWILALVIIAAVIYFAFRAWVFFRH